MSEDIDFGDVVTVDLTNADEAFLEVIHKRYYGIVNYKIKDDEDGWRAHISWFSNGCHYTTWWPVKLLVKIDNIIGHTDEIEADNFDWLVQSINIFEASNPMS